jgi:hypothetical protein
MVAKNKKRVLRTHPPLPRGHGLKYSLSFDPVDLLQAVILSPRADNPTCDSDADADSDEDHESSRYDDESCSSDEETIKVEANQVDEDSSDDATCEEESDEDEDNDESFDGDDQSVDSDEDCDDDCSEEDSADDYSDEDSDEDHDDCSDENHDADDDTSCISDASTVEEPPARSRTKTNASGAPPRLCQNCGNSRNHAARDCPAPRAFCPCCQKYGHLLTYCLKDSGTDPVLSKKFRGVA